MSAHCQVTGRIPGFGNAVSHSRRRTRRRWSPNIQLKTYYLLSEGRRIRLRVSANQSDRLGRHRGSGGAVASPRTVNLMVRNEIRPQTSVHRRDRLHLYDPKEPAQ